MTAGTTSGPGVFVGVDVGTSMAKAAAFDRTGATLAVASRPVPLQHPGPGRVEQDPDVIVGSVRAVLAEVNRATGVRSPEVVAITGQGDGCWLFDDRGVPVRTGVSWMDGRAAGVLGEWTDQGIPDEIFTVNGNLLFPGAAAPILAWLDRYEPAALDEATTAGYIKDLIFQRMTGVRATDASDASLPFGSLAPGEDYAARILELTGLTHRRDLLAPIVRPVPSGTLTAAGAGATGLQAGVPVTAGPYDIPACAMGSGVDNPGDGLLIAGTTLACSVLTDRYDLTGRHAGMTVTMPQPDRWLRVMAAMVGTACLDWVMATLLAGFDQLESILGESPAGARGVEVLPYFAPSGERAPFVHPGATGQFSGIDLTTTRADIIRGVCEGLAYAARDCFSAADLTGTVFVCGGGSASRAWMQIFASVLNRPLSLARAGEVGARGAVLAASDALDLGLDRAEWTAPSAVIEPDPAAVEVYEEGFRRYLSHQVLAREMWVR